MKKKNINIKTIKDILVKKCYTKNVFIIDHSKKHNIRISHQTITHLQIVIVSQFFLDQTLLKRHRTVQKIINHYIKYSIYSISIHTYTDSEWKKINKKILINTSCKKKICINN